MELGEGRPPDIGFWDLAGGMALAGAGVTGVWIYFIWASGSPVYVIGYPVGGGSRRIPVPQDVRWTVFQRDGYQCGHCGSTVDLTIDHIQPVIWGGSNDPSNLQTLCRSCNSVKGDIW